MCNIFARHTPLPPPILYGRTLKQIFKVEYRDAAANCSSDDEDLAAALAGEESSGGGGSGGGEVEGEGGRVGAYGYVSDGFLVPDDVEEVRCFFT